MDMHITTVSTETALAFDESLRKYKHKKQTGKRCKSIFFSQLIMYMTTAF